MRDAQSLMDQVIAFCGMNVETSRLREALNLIDLDFFFEVSEAIANRNPARAFELSGEIISRGYDVEEFFSGLLEHFRNIFTVLITNTTKLLEVSKAHQERYAAHAREFAEADLLRLVRLGQNAFERLKATHDPRIVLEVALVEMMMMERALEVSQLIEEVRALRGMPATQRTPSMAPTPTSAPALEKKSSDIAAGPANGSLPPSIPKASVPTSTAKSQTLQAPVPEQKETLDTQTVASRWIAFGEFLKTKSRPLHSILPELEFSGIRRSTVYLAVPGSIEKNMLMNMKDEMQLALKEFFGIPLQFEAGPKSEMHVKAGSPVVLNPEIVAQIAPTAKQPNMERSELEIALLEMGAQEV